MIKEEQIEMAAIASKELITIQKLEKEFDSLRKKLFIYETLNAEKEIKMRKTEGPFKSSKEVIKHIKR